MLYFLIQLDEIIREFRFDLLKCIEYLILVSRILGSGGAPPPPRREILATPMYTLRYHSMKFIQFKRYKCDRNHGAVRVQSSYQLVDAERYDDERQQEVGDGKAGDDAVGHVLKLWLQQQGEQDKAVAGDNPHRDNGQRQQAPLWRQRRPAVRVADAVRFWSAEFWRSLDDDVIRRVHSRHVFDRRRISCKVRFQQSDLVLLLVLNAHFFVNTLASDWTRLC